MATLEIIPAIDIIDGKCVRLEQGNYSLKKIYNENPVEVAKRFEQAGCKRLHVVDLDGAKQKKICNHKILKEITSQTQLLVDFGGGIQSDDDIKIAFDSGVSQITGGSVAVKNPDLFLKWLSEYGTKKIILGADMSNNKIAVSGWQSITEISVFDFIATFQEKGISSVISTDISKDGMLQGTSIDYYEKLCVRFPMLKIIASGGISSLKDIENLAILPVFGVIVGKALYEDRISLDELLQWNLKK